MVDLHNLERVAGRITFRHRTEAIAGDLRAFPCSRELLWVEAFDPRPDRVPAGRSEVLVPAEPTHLLVQGADARFLPGRVGGPDRRRDDRFDLLRESTRTWPRSWRPRQERARHGPGPIAVQELVEPSPSQPERPAGERDVAAAEMVGRGQRPDHSLPGYRLRPGSRVRQRCVAPSIHSGLRRDRRPPIKREKSAESARIRS